ncbi:MAG: T9SS type A sorting domain-containing protein [Saprospiraceae bacterium]
MLTEIDDADIPGTYYPRGSGDTTIYHGHEPIHLIERLDDMQIESEAELCQQNEQLANENQTIKMEMSSCCAEAAKGMDLPYSIRCKIPPNPFPNGYQNPILHWGKMQKRQKVEIRNADGILLKSYDLQQRHRFNDADVSDFANGSYVYTLSVDGKIVDSKVMICNNLCEKLKT